jgi:hypothetical protein
MVLGFALPSNREVFSKICIRSTQPTGYKISDHTKELSWQSISQPTRATGEAIAPKLGGFSGQWIMTNIVRQSCIN